MSCNTTVLPPLAVEIHWGGKVYQFASAAEALKAGFQIAQDKKGAEVQSK